MGLASHEIDWLRRMVRQRRELAERDNDTVYSDKVPDINDLPSIPGQSMMTTLPPLDEELEPSMLQRPIFVGLAKV